MTTVEIAEAERRIRDFKAVHLVKKEVESKPINSGDFGALNVPCPKCGGEVRDDYTMLQCTKCDFSLLKIVAGRQMEVSEVEDLIATKHVGPLDGFHDEKGNAFSASLKLNDAFKVEFDFGKNDER